MNLVDSTKLAGWQYQFSISPQIAEERFEDFLAEASEKAQIWATICLGLYHDGLSWMASIEATKKLFRDGSKEELADAIIKSGFFEQEAETSAISKEHRTT